MNELDLIPFRTLLDHVVVPARRHARKTVLATALPLTLASVTVAIAQIRWSQMALNPDPENMGEFFAGFFVIMAISLLSIFVFVMTFSALVVASMDAVSGREVRMSRAWAFIGRPAVFLTIVLVTFLNVVSFMMCFFPALYVVPLLSFTLPVMVAEGRTGLDALGRGADLFRFNPTGRLSHSPWIQTLLVLLVGSLLTYAISLTVQLPFAVAQQVLILRETFANPDAAMEELTAVFWLQLPASILGALVTSFTWLYSTFGICLLYRELRRRKEAEDLVEALDQLTGDPRRDGAAGDGETVFA